MISPSLMAWGKTKPAAAKETAHINWLSIDDLQTKMKEKPKKVYMDMYTDWCGWCKKMEASTFTNPDVIKYMNENFYCVRFNAERKDTFRFMGTAYYYDPGKKANTLAINLMKGTMSYPTSIIMEERYQNPQPIPGYQDVKTMEMILKYFGDNIYKSKQWPDYQKDFKGTWIVAEEANPAPPPGH
jgi:thioredoxin-related protein